MAVAQIIHAIVFARGGGLEYYGGAILCDFFALCGLYYARQGMPLMWLCLTYIVVNFGALGLYVVNGITDSPIDFASGYKNCMAALLLIQIAVIWRNTDDGGSRVGTANRLAFMAFWHRMFGRSNVYKGTK